MPKQTACHHLLFLCWYRTPMVLYQLEAMKPQSVLLSIILMLISHRSDSYTNSRNTRRSRSSRNSTKNAN